MTDGVGATADTPAVAVATEPLLSVGYIRLGQSITAIEPNVGAYVTDSLGDLGPSFLEVNVGVSGSKTYDWLPGAAIQTGAANNWTTHLATVNSAFSGHTFDRIIVRLEFGVNDASSGTVSTASYVANLQALIAALLANPYAASTVPVSVYLLSPLPPQIFTAAVREQVRQYMIATRGLADGVSVYYMGDDVYNRFVGRPDLYDATGYHPDTALHAGQAQTGAVTMAKTEADGFVRTFLGEGATGGGGGLRGVIMSNTLQYIG